MKTYLELKDQTRWLTFFTPALPILKDLTLCHPRRYKPSRARPQRKQKRRNKTQQTNKRQYKTRVVEKPLILSTVSATLIPTTAAATQPMISNQTRATTLWPSTFPASANLFVSRTWTIPPNKESSPALSKQKMVESDIPKSESAPTWKIAISHPLPLVQKGSVIASYPGTTNIMAVPTMQSSGKRCKASCPICAQSALYSSPADSDCSKEDWDGEIKDEDKMRKKQRKEKLEKPSGYYPPEPIYDPSLEKEVQFLVSVKYMYSLIPN